MHPTLQKTPPVDVIHCIGDSHVSFFSGQDVIQPNWPARSEDLLPCFVTHHLGPALAYNLSRTETQTRGRERLLEILEQAVPRGARVLLCFGEIDCRAQVLKQAQRRKLPVAQVVSECLDAYFQVVREVQARGFEVVVYNAIPSRSRTARPANNDNDYVAIGSWQERNAAIREFNAGAKARCRECGTKFLETFPALITAEGKAINWYYFDNIHLSQRAMPLTLQALRGLFPDSNYPDLLIARPTRADEIWDALAKRMRRWLKLKPPRRATLIRS